MFVYIALVVTTIAGVRAQVDTVDIPSKEGCGAGGYLVEGNNDCEINELMGANGTLVFSFKVSPKARHGVLVTLRSVGAQAIM